MLSLALPLLLAAAPAYSAEQIADAKCLAAFSIVASSKDKNTAEATIPGGFYFTGKLFAREPNLDLTSILRLVSKDVKANLSTELGRCSNELVATSKIMAASGQTLAAEGI